jgi:hypothetical protein
MSLILNIKGDFTLQEASEVIREALAYNERITKYKIKKYSGICEDFEIKYGMGSDIFLEKFEAGDLGDDNDLFDWYFAKRGLDIWNKRLKIISATEIRIC